MTAWVRGKEKIISWHLTRLMDFYSEDGWGRGCWWCNMVVPLCCALCRALICLLETSSAECSAMRILTWLSILKCSTARPPNGRLTDVQITMIHQNSKGEKLHCLCGFVLLVHLPRICECLVLMRANLVCNHNWPQAGHLHGTAHTWLYRTLCLSAVLWRHLGCANFFGWKRTRCRK